MARINLLPWREEKRRLRQRQFTVVLIVVGVASAFVSGLIYLGYDGAIANQNARNQYLTDQIKLMDDKIAQIKDLQDKKQRLLARMQIIEQLQESRPIEVHLFDQLVKTLPSGVYLTSVQQNNDNLTLSGVAESSARVSTYLRNIDASLWLGSPNLVVVQKDANKSGAQNFTITAKVLDKTAQQKVADAGGAP
ncbi:MAG TPA: PilN domain-containing protein [Gammaproteobacteria bacterium]|nr:PilN domain-containing protein [Gammaproteobacteria bacterium]